MHQAWNLAMICRTLLCLTFFCLPVTLSLADDNASAWKALFDGKSLDGWVVKCLPKDKDKHYWMVEDGTITAHVPNGSDHNYIWLLTTAEYDNFELKLKVQTTSSSRGNSGVQVRSRYDDQAGWLDGPQIDIHPPGPWRSGFLYDETRGVKRWLAPIVGKPSDAKESDAPQGWNWKHADRDANAWNDITIICNGTSIRSIVNGVTVSDLDGEGILDDQHHQRANVGLKGHIGLQIHPGQQMLVRFKDIQLRPLPK
jgi:hypothetical protein